MLGIIKLWHKDLFANWGDNEIDEKFKFIDDFSIALHLIDKLSIKCSKERLELIDEILSEAAKFDIEAENYLNKEWIYLRKKFSENCETKACRAAEATPSTNEG